MPELLRLKAACIAAVSLASIGMAERARAAESGFSIYPLGSLAFGAGATPPPGFYVTSATGYYKAIIQTNNLIGGVATLGLDVKFLQQQYNFMYVPTAQFLGGQLGLSVNVPAGCVNLDAAIVIIRSRSESVSGCGFGDMWARAQLGWHLGDFLHTIYVTGFAPTGRYDTGFNPNIGLNRPAVDVTWAASWLERTTGIEFSGAAGFTFNAENTATQYKSGDELHFEWAVGKKFGALQLGFAGYHYWQITDDSGPGATLGAFRGQINGVGPAASYVTKIADNIVVFNARIYFEYGAMNRFEGATSLASATVRF
jgi:hypothetical protein